MEKVDAIYTLERLAHTETKWPGTEETLEALDMAVKALRLIATVDHFPDSTKMIHDSDFVDTNKMVPLTLEQLREKVGQPVVIKYSYGGPYTFVIVDVRYVPHLGADKIRLVFPDGYITVNERDYGTYFTTYAYPPAHIDREAWEPCRVCGQYEVLGFRGWRRKENILKPPDGSGGCMYCPHCGRPRNDKAWDQLEQRLRGEQVDEQERGRSEAGDTGPLLLPQEQCLL